MKKSLYFILCFTFLNVLYSMDEEVIVTSSLGGATLAEIDSPIFVITGDDINYTGSTNLGDSIDYLLGVNSSSFGPGVRQNSHSSPAHSSNDRLSNSRTKA